MRSRGGGRNEIGRDSPKPKLTIQAVGASRRPLEPRFDGNERRFRIFDLTRFPDASRFPLRSKTPLLPARNAAHVGQMMGYALVAVDAGFLARKQEALMGNGGAG